MKSGWDRIEELALTVASRWRFHPDHEDIVQELRVFMWQNEDLSDSHLMWLGKHRVIDSLRLMEGRKGSERYAFRKELVYLGEYALNHPNEFDDEIDPSVEFGFSGRNAKIVKMLSEGRQRVEIADKFGVHPSRITQILRRVRAKILETNPEYG